MAARWIEDDESYPHVRRERKPPVNLYLPFLVGLAASALALGWMALTVVYNHRGDWSALFYTGSTVRVPAAIDFERTYQFPRSPGFDGQFYHFIAHDPWITRGFDRNVDNPRLRWRRILLPGLAWMFAAGNDEGIDAGFVATILLFVALGAMWVGRHAGVAGLSPAWGLLFLAVPATIVSLDRMTVDVALCALCAAFAVYATPQPAWRMLGPVLAAAPLARETGLCLPVAYALYALRRKQWRDAGIAVLTSLPAGLWTLYVHAHTAADLTKWTGFPLAGLIARTAHPFPYATPTDWLKQAAMLDFIAILGMWLALALAVQAFLLRGPGPLELACGLFAAAAIALSKPDIWTEAYAFTRTQSPLLLCLALAGWPTQFWTSAIPLALSIPRITFQLGPQFFGILHAWLGKRP
ncbi:MAG: hypothetical protein ACKV22_27325 [Bryobacteraceae bacterium]